MTLRWLAGLVARRRARLVAAAAGVAVAVALIASIGAFLAGSTAAMTDRALARVPLDWQVQAEAGASLPKLLRAVRAFPGRADRPARAVRAYHRLPRICGRSDEHCLRRTRARRAGRLPGDVPG